MTTDFFKDAKKSSFNTNNGWGFGGGYGYMYELPDGYAVKFGTACYRHAPSHSYTTIYFNGIRIYDVHGKNQAKAVDFIENHRKKSL